MTQRKLAKLVGVTPEWMNTIFNHPKKRPSGETAENLELITKIPAKVWREGTKFQIRKQFRDFNKNQKSA